MSLASASNNTPWICEVHYAYDDNLNIYFRSLLSRRHTQEILKNPKVAGNMVTQHFLDSPVRAVYFEGEARLIEDDNDLQIAYKCISERLDLGKEILEDATKDDGHKFFKITVNKFYLFDSITSNPSQKYELVWGKK
jgi:nitroimidazol reductase NimA-like FMN-containing flavoprotein (pyridoxamine 5'-phosphate oxidase superfamily)